MIYFGSNMKPKLWVHWSPN